MPTPKNQSRSTPKPLALFALLPFLSLFLFSCDSLRNEVDPNRLNKEAAKLVVTGFISPQDTVLAVQVNRSVPVLGQSNAIRDVANATVTIRDGSQSVTLRYAVNYNRQNVNLYWASARSFPIVAGKTYTLTVETPNGQKATGQCTVPARAPIPELQLDSAVVSRGFASFGTNGRQDVYTKEYTVRARWFDIGGQRNYYRVAGLFQYQATPPASSTAVNPVIIQTVSFNANFSNSGTVADSPSTDGGLLTSRESVFYRPNQNFIVSGPTGTTVTSQADASQLQLGKLLRFGVLTISLLHTDEMYYRYHDAISRQQDTGDNPFAEPVQIPTNISDGLGCFAGYNRSVVVLRVK